MQDKEGKFMGFASPRYTQVPDEIFDELLPELSGAELKTLMYVVRRTFGFKKESDHISLSQLVNGITTKEGRILDRGTGLHKESVIKATKSLTDKGILVRTRVQSETHGFGASEYSLRMASIPLSVFPAKGVDRQIRPAIPAESDQQDTVRQETYRTFSKPVDNSNKLKEKELLGQILLVCRDLHSYPYYKQLVRTAPHQTIYAALSQVRDAQATGRIRTSPARMFTDLVQRVR
jgi:hypothetical protein